MSASLIFKLLRGLEVGICQLCLLFQEEPSFTAQSFAKQGWFPCVCQASTHCTCGPEHWEFGKEGAGARWVYAAIGILGYSVHPCACCPVLGAVSTASAEREIKIKNESPLLSFMILKGSFLDFHDIVVQFGLINPRAPCGFTAEM